MCSIPDADADAVLLVDDGPDEADAAWTELTEQVRADWALSPWQRFAHLFTLDPGELSGPGTRPADSELLRRMRDCEALTTQLMAEQARALLELRRRRLVDQDAAHPHPEQGCSGACCDGDGWVAMEVGLELGLSERQVTSRLDTALRMDRHPDVVAAMDDGLLQAWTATKLLEHLQTLGQYVDAERLAAVESATLAWLLATPRTVAQLNARMRRLILAAQAAANSGADADVGGSGCDPHGIGWAAAQRRVTVAPASTPGLAELVALLPEADALAVRATLRALSYDRSDPDDRRTGDQRRADLLVTLVTGAPARLGRLQDAQCALRDPVDVQVRLDVTVPADALTGGGAPAEVPGYGSVPAVTARGLAAPHGAAAGGAGCTARPLVYDPATGRLLGFGASAVPIRWLDELPIGRGYQHAPSLDTAVRLRDGMCRAPGCRRAASRCDCDHVMPYPRGQTSLANSCCLCRRHHRLKTHAPGWTVTGNGDALTWRTPTGGTVTTHPNDYRPLGPPAADPSDDPPPF